MDYRRLVCILFLTLANILIIKAASRRHKHHNRHYADYGENYHTQLSALTFDHLGNCYVQAAHLEGRCVRYQECQSAVNAWQKHQQIPFSCYYTLYDNVVCCPEAFIKPIQISATPLSPLPLPPPQTIPYNPLIMQASAAQLSTPEHTTSEKQCASIYNNLEDRDNHHRRQHHRHHHHRHHHHSKREANVTESNVDTDYSSSEAVAEEETIEKVQVSDTQAVGGIRTQQDEFPYMCALGWRKSSAKRADISYRCGCVLIDHKYALTAAHCASLGRETPSVVRLGGDDLDDRQGEMLKIQRIVQHPDYDSRWAYNDIAIVKLQKRSRHTPACLWTNVGLPEHTLTALGYGQTKFAGPTSNSLLKVYLKVLTNQNCNSYYGSAEKLVNGISLGQICAGDPQGKMDTCQGDSGGPLLMQVAKYNTQVPYVVGLTSFGEGCATNSPSVYTRISYFIDWIEEMVWK